MVKVSFTRGQLLDINLLGVQLTIPPVSFTLFDTDWITNGVSGLFAPQEDIWSKGDANRDHVINDEDRAIVEAAYGKREGQEGYNPDADFNQDGKVDLDDVMILGYNYGLDRRGGKATQWLMLSFATFFTGVAITLAKGVWDFFENTLDSMSETYYAGIEEE